MRTSMSPQVEFPLQVCRLVSTGLETGDRLYEPSEATHDLNEELRIYLQS